MSYVNRQKDNRKFDILFETKKRLLYLITSGFVRPSLSASLPGVFLSYTLGAFTDSKVITCMASSAIKWQVHSPLINAEARTPAISRQEGWNVLNEPLQNKHTAVHGCVT